MKLLKKIIHFRIAPEQGDLASGLFATGIALLAFGATFSYSASALTSVIGPVTIPRLVSLLILALGLWLIIRYFRSKKKADSGAPAKASTVPLETEGEPGELDKLQLFRAITPWASFLLIALYISLMRKLGFTLASALYLTFQIPLLSVDLSKKCILKSLVIGVVTATVVFLIFAKGFGLHLPVNSFGF